MCHRTKSATRLAHAHMSHQHAAHCTSHITHAIDSGTAPADQSTCKYICNTPGQAVSTHASITHTLCCILSIPPAMATHMQYSWAAYQLARQAVIYICAHAAGQAAHITTKCMHHTNSWQAAWRTCVQVRMHVHAQMSCCTPWAVHACISHVTGRAHPTYMQHSLAALGMSPGSAHKQY